MVESKSLSVSLYEREMPESYVVLRRRIL